MKHLFQSGQFLAHSGQMLDWKVDCDTLEDADFECLAKLVEIDFSDVVGIPRGGLRFAEALRHYISSSRDPVLIVDYVVTTGKSMNEMRDKIDRPSVGVVIFARAKPPTWVTAIWQFNE